MANIKKSIFSLETALALVLSPILISPIILIGSAAQKNEESKTLILKRQRDYAQTPEHYITTQPSLIPYQLNTEAEYR